MVRDSWPATVEKFTQAFATRTRDEWGELAARRDCCVAPVLDFIEAAGDRHNLDNGLYKNDPFPQTAKIFDFDRAL